MRACGERSAARRRGVEPVYVLGLLLLAGCTSPPPPASDPAPRANRFSTIPAGIEAERITFSLDGSTVVWIEKSPTGDRVVRDGRPFPKYGFI